MMADLTLAQLKQAYDAAQEQMAAEAFLSPNMNPEQIKKALKIGNNPEGADPNAADLPGKLRMTQSQADAFVARYDIIDAQSDDAAGFAAVALRDTKGDDDPSNDQVIIAVRSTEFALDRPHDVATDLQIGLKGFAFEQILSMEAFKDKVRTELLAGLSPDIPFNLVGYSLSGNVVRTMAAMLPTEFNQAPSSNVVFNPTGLGDFRERSNYLGPTRSRAEIVQDMMTTYQDALIVSPDFTPSDVADYLAGLDPSSPADQNLLQLYEDAKAASVIDRTDPALSVYGTPRSNFAEAITSRMFGTGYSAFGTTAAELSFAQYFGHALSGYDGETVANSGVHPAPLSIPIEGQPLIEVSIPRVDFLNTHSLTLVTDSLRLLMLFKEVDPNITLDDLQNILKASSAESAGIANSVESDTLEKALDGLRKVFLPEYQFFAPTPSEPVPGGFGDLDDRAFYYGNIAEVEDALPAQHSYSIQSLAGSSAAGLLLNANGNDSIGLAYRFALKELNPFAVIGFDYAQHNVNGALEKLTPDTATGQLTAQYLEDRADFLVKKLETNTANGGVLAGRSNSFNDTHFKDVRTKDEIQVGLFSAITGQQEFLFDDDAGHALAGGSKDDHLFGGGGDDALTGGGGDDYLEGDQGNDTLDGGEGFDTYVYRINDNLDTITDSDGQGKIIYDTHPVDGGIRKTTDPANTYHGGAQGAMTYAWDGPGTNLVINNLITVQGFHNGDLGIQLTQENLQASPPVIDFNNTLPLRTHYEIYWDSHQNPLNPTANVGYVDLLTPVNDPSGSYNYNADPQTQSLGFPVFLNPDFPYYVADSDPPLAFQFTGDEYLDYHLVGSGYIGGGPGNDRLYAGDGDATLWGGDGNDQLLGGSGNDSLDGAAGDDSLVGGGGDDTMMGGSGSNVLVAGTGNVIMWGWGPALGGVSPAPPPPPTPGDSGGDGGGLPPPPPPDPDLLPPPTPPNPPSFVLGPQEPVGNNYLIGGSGNDTMISGPGDDTLDVRSSGNALLEGGAGTNAILFGRGSGQDTLDDSSIFGRPGTGNAPGTDIIHFSPDVAPGDVTVTADNNLGLVLGITGATAQLTVSQFFAASYPQIIQVAFADGTVWGAATLTAMELANTDGNDSLVGTPRNDQIFGGKGDDALIGGAGSDTYVFNLGDGVDTIVDTAVPGEGNIVVFGDGIASNSLSLGLGSLLIHYDDYGDAIHITNFDPNDTFGPHAVGMFQFSDGTALSYNDLIGLGFNLTGTAGDDLITGTNVVDRISALEGNDFIQAGVGNDVLSGGAGSDVYLFNLGDGADTIHDVSTSSEGNSLVFGAGITQADLTFTRGTNALTIAYGAFGDAIMLDEFDPTNVNGALVVSTLQFADGNTVSLRDLLNTAPTVANPIADQSTQEDAVFSFVVPANTFADVDAGDALTLNATLADGNPLPAWLSFDASTGTFSGTPGNSDVGSANITLMATDSGNLSASNVFALTVTNVNDAPTVVNALADRMAVEDSAFSFIVPGGTFSDADLGDILTLSAALGDGNPLPAWLSFDAVTSTLSGTPSFDDIGTIGVTMTATDSGGLNASDMYVLTVRISPDQMVVGTDGCDVLKTSSGNDMIDAGDGNDTVSAGRGNDTITGGAGDDILSGGLGNDTYVYSLGDGLDHIVDPAGVDTVSFGAGISFDAVVARLTMASGLTTAHLRLLDAGGCEQPDQGMEITLGTGGVSPIESFAFANGMEFSLSDLVIQTKVTNGTRHDDVIRTGREDDVIYTQNGDDLVYAGSGNDTVYAGNGKDSVYGEGGNDRLYGGNGKDLLDGGCGDDLMSGGSGKDTLLGGEGNDTLLGRNGEDTLQGGAGDDVLDTGKGDDTILFGRGDGHDRLVGLDNNHDDEVEFGAGITREHVWFQKDGNDLIVSVLGTAGSSDQLTIADWYANEKNQIDEFQTATEGELEAKHVEQLVQAMAAFAPPALSADMTLPANIQQQLAPALAAVWEGGHHS